MNARFYLLAAVLVSGSSRAAAVNAQEKRPELLFQEAWYREIAEGRLEEAAGIYRRLAERTEVARAIRARAWLRLGICQGKLGRKQEARDALERVPKDFADIEDAVRAARLELEGESEAEAGFRLKVEGLVARLGEKGLEETVHTDRGSRQVRNPVVESLEGIGPRAAPHLFPALGKSDFYTGQNAAEILVRFAEQEPELQSKVVAALRSGDAIVKKSIAQALERNTLPAWVPTLAALLEDPDQSIRTTAIRTLKRNLFAKPTVPGVANSPDPRALEALKRAVSDSMPELRSLALEALGRHGLDAPIEVIVSSIRDGDAAVRRIAVETLSKAIESSSQAERIDAGALLDRLEDPDILVAAAAIDGLAKLKFKLDQSKSGKSIFTGKQEAGIAKLAAWAAKSAAPVQQRVKAVDLIGAAGLAPASPHLRKLLKAPEPEIARAAVNELVELDDQSAASDILDITLNTGQKDLKEAAWKALVGKLSSPAVIKSLVENLDRLGPFSQGAFSAFNWLERRDLVIAALRHYRVVDEQTRLSMLEAIRRLTENQGRFPESLPAVRDGLDDQNPRIRAMAAMAASQLAEPSLYSRLIESLSDPEDRVRSWALEAMGKQGDAKAVPALLEILKSPNLQFVNKACNLLARIAGREIMKQLLPLLSESANLSQPFEVMGLVGQIAQPADAPLIAAAFPSMRPDVRLEAVSLLGRLKNAAVIDSVRAQLADSDPRMRQAALEAIAGIGPAGAAANLIAALKDPDVSTRGAALKALDSFEAAKILVVPEAIDSLARCVEEPGESIRQAAAAVLARLRDPRAVPALIKALRLGEAPVAASPAPRPGGPGRLPGPAPALRPAGQPGKSTAEIAAKALREFGGRQTVMPLLEILANPDDPGLWMENQILEILWRHARGDDAKVIAAALPKVSTSARQRLIGLLGSFANPEILPALKESLGDADEKVRQQTVDALEKIGGAEALALIQGALGDDAPAVRIRAAKALRSFKVEGAFQTLLAAFKKEESQEVLLEIIAALEKFADPRATPALLIRLKDSQQQFGVALWSLTAYPPEAAVHALAEVLESNALDIPIKTEALHVLSRISHARALELVVSRLDSPDRGLRKEAISVLGHFLDPRVLPRLVEALRDPDDEIRKAARQSIEEIRYFLEQKSFAGKLGDEANAAGEIIRMLKSDKPDARISAIQALVRLKVREALPELVRLRKDPDEAVRKAVEEALDEITRTEKRE